jgi:hypothetical protein
VAVKFDEPPVGSMVRIAGYAARGEPYRWHGHSGVVTSTDPARGEVGMMHTDGCRCAGEVTFHVAAAVERVQS